MSAQRLFEALKARRRRVPRARGCLLEAILARLTDLEKRRDGLIDLALDGPLFKAELSERLLLMDARVKALRGETEDLRREE